MFENSNLSKIEPKSAEIDLGVLAISVLQVPLWAVRARDVDISSVVCEDYGNLEPTV